MPACFRACGVLLGAVVGLSGCQGGHDVPAASGEQDSSGATTQPATSTPTSTGTTSVSATGTDPTSAGTGGAGVGTTGGSDAATSSDVGTTASSTSCGDGQVDGDEQCDLGFGLNVDSGDCTSTCRLPACGDGHVWAGYEACDRGDANNDTTFAGCKTDCTPGPRCGDGILQLGHEECDAGEGVNGSGESPDADHVPCGLECRFSARVVFATSLKYTGDLAGLAGADGRCQAAALAGGLDNHTHFLAWLSDAAASPSSRFTRGPEVVGVPYVLPNGQKVADDWDALVAEGPRRGIYVDEFAEVHEDDVQVWTNTTGTGDVLSPVQHCAGWSSSQSQQATRRGIGFIPVDPVDVWKMWKAGRWWTDLNTKGCDNSHRLYCFEQ